MILNESKSPVSVKYFLFEKRLHSIKSTENKKISNLPSNLHFLSIDYK